jgi:hypothetical protein
MIKWRPYSLNGVVYDLTHLHPTTVKYTQDQKDGAREYTVDVAFGLHCFTRGAADGEIVDPKAQYADAKESRVFDKDRYELSKRLPDLVKALSTAKCYHTDRGNFFTVDIIREENKILQYEVYFTIFLSGTGTLVLRVQSAYVRDSKHRVNRKGKSVRFFILLFNTQMGR